MFDSFFPVYEKFGSCLPCSSTVAINYISANVVVTQKTSLAGWDSYAQTLT